MSPGGYSLSRYLIIQWIDSQIVPGNPLVEWSTPVAAQESRMIILVFLYRRFQLHLHLQIRPRQPHPHPQILLLLRRRRYPRLLAPLPILQAAECGIQPALSQCASEKLSQSSSWLH